MSAINPKIKRFVTIALAVFSGGCSFSSKTGGVGAQPKGTPPEEVAAIIRAIPTYTIFTYAGASYFNGKLYASSNIGLLEFNQGTLTRLYKWLPGDDVVSGPWLDNANHSLWAMHDRLGKLIRFDGHDWKFVRLPRPKGGYTRGDMLNGFRGIGTADGFWLEGGANAWRWNNEKSKWEPIPMPEDGSLVRILPLPTGVLMVMRHESLDFLVKEGQKFKSDTIHYFQDGWREIPNKTGVNFFAEQSIVIGDVGYVRTRSGLILRATASEILTLDAPGACEGMVALPAGSLLASFRGVGIYEHTNVWQKRFSCPYPADEAEHWAYLAGSEGQTAFEITSKPKLENETFTYPGQTTLWLSEGSELTVVRFK